MLWQKKTTVAVPGKYTVKAELYVFDGESSVKAQAAFRVEGKNYAVRINEDSVYAWERNDGLSEGELKVENGEIVDYDGCFELNEEVRNILRSMGLLKG